MNVERDDELRRRSELGEREGLERLDEDQRDSPQEEMGADPANDRFERQAEIGGTPSAEAVDEVLDIDTTLDVNVDGT